MNLQNTRNETALWKLFREGDEQAFSMLFELTSDRLYRYGTKFVNDGELVKDCIHNYLLSYMKTATSSRL